MLRARPCIPPATPHGGCGAITFAAPPVGISEPTHPSTEEPPALRARPLTGALNHRLLLLAAGCLQLHPRPKAAAQSVGEEIVRAPGSPFPSIGIVSVKSSL